MKCLDFLQNLAEKLVGMEQEDESVDKSMSHTFESEDEKYDQIDSAEFNIKKVQNRLEVSLEVIDEGDENNLSINKRISSELKLHSELKSLTRVESAA